MARHAAFVDFFWLLGFTDFTRPVRQHLPFILQKPMCTERHANTQHKWRGRRETYIGPTSQCLVHLAVETDHFRYNTR